MRLLRRTCARQRALDDRPRTSVPTTQLSSGRVTALVGRGAGREQFRAWVSDAVGPRVVFVHWPVRIGTAQRDRTSTPRSRRQCCSKSVKEDLTANYSRWYDSKDKRRPPTDETRAAVQQDLALGQLIYDLRTEAGLSQRELVARMSTTSR